MGLKVGRRGGKRRIVHPPQEGKYTKGESKIRKLLDFHQTDVPEQAIA